MRIIPLANIASMEDGEIVPAVNAVIKKVFDVREGTGKNKKPYKFQDIILEDGDLEVKVTFNDCESIPRKKEGDKIVLNCSTNKHGLTGVKIKWDDYIPDRAPDGYKGQNIIWVTPSAEIAYEGTGDSGGRSQAPAEDSPRQAANTNPAPTSLPGGANKAEALGIVKKVIARAANILVLAIEGAEYAADVVEKSKGIKIPPEARAAHASTLFIEACHHGAMKVIPIVDLRTFDPAKEKEKAKSAQAAEGDDKAKAEAERKAREEKERAEAEAARKAREERERKEREAIDEDVPF